MHTSAERTRRRLKTLETLLRNDPKGKTQYTWVRLYTHHNLTYQLLERNLAGTAISEISGVALIATHPLCWKQTDKLSNLTYLQ
jgi:hypothetical protein